MSEITVSLMTEADVDAIHAIEVAWDRGDIDTLNWKNRGSRRIIYSNDGLIFYTGDHYESFEQLYGEG